MASYLNLKILFTAALIGFFVLIAYPAWAGLVPCTGAGGGNPCNVCHLFQLISNVANFIVKDITAPLAGLLFLIGGIMMIAAGGSEERFKKGKQIFVNTVIGAVIVLASWLIINTLINALGASAPGFDPSSWWRVNCRLN